MNDDLRAELQEKLKTSEAQIASKERRFKKRVQDFQNKVSKGLVTRAEAAQLEQNLGVEQQQLMQLQNQLQMQLAEEDQVASRKVLNSIMEYLESLQSESQFEYVLGTSFGGNVLYANDQLNITEKVIEGLNTNYATSKESTETTEE